MGFNFFGGSELELAVYLNRPAQLKILRLGGSYSIAECAILTASASDIAGVTSVLFAARVVFFLRNQFWQRAGQGQRRAGSGGKHLVGGTFWGSGCASWICSPAE